MAELNRKAIEHVASLAKLKLSEDDLSYYEGRLQQIIHYFTQMDQLTTKLENWRGDTIGETTPERADTAVASGVPDAALEQAPSRVGSAFQVPKIIE